MNKKHLFLALALLAGLILTIVVAFSAARAGTALLYLDPETTIRGPGETVSMTIQLESGVQVVGAEVYLAYDPAILEVIDADTMTDTVQIYPGDCPEPEFLVLNEVNVISGTISYAVVDLGADAGCTAGRVAAIEFQCVGLGTSNVTFDPDTYLSDSEGVSITLTTQDAAITCTDMTSTPGPTATPTAKNTPTPTLTPTSPNVYLPITNHDPTLTPTPTNTPTATPTPWITLLNDTFEGDFPGPWQLSTNTNEQYHWGKRNCRGFQSANSAWAVGGGSVGGSSGCFIEYPDSAFNWMVYGPFSLEGMSAAEMTFQVWLNSELSEDFLCYVASGLGGFDGSNYEGYCLSGDSSEEPGNIDGWVNFNLDLTDIYGDGSVSLLGDSSVWIAFLFTSDESINFPEGGYVDNVIIRKCASGCPPVQTFFRPEGSNFLLQPFDGTFPFDLKK